MFTIAGYILSTYLAITSTLHLHNSTIGVNLLVSPLMAKAAKYQRGRLRNVPKSHSY